MEKTEPAPAHEEQPAQELPAQQDAGEEVNSGQPSVLEALANRSLEAQAKKARRLATQPFGVEH